MGFLTPAGAPDPTVQGLSVADYLVVATAIKLKLVVLHEDADFETVARIIPQFQEQRLGAP